jgi:hypothetical protein
MKSGRVEGINVFYEAGRPFGGIRSMLVPAVLIRGGALPGNDSHLFT